MSIEEKPYRPWGGLHVSFVSLISYSVISLFFGAFRHMVISEHLSRVKVLQVCPFLTYCKNSLNNALSHQPLLPEWVTGHSGQRQVQDRSTFLWLRVLGEYKKWIIFAPV